MTSQDNEMYLKIIVLDDIGFQQVRSDPDRRREDFRIVYTSRFQGVVKVDFDIKAILHQHVSGLRKPLLISGGNEGLKDVRRF